MIDTTYFTSADICISTGCGSAYVTSTLDTGGDFYDMNFYLVDGLYIFGSGNPTSGDAVFNVICAHD